MDFLIDSNAPERYATLPAPAKDILQQWIQHTIQPASRIYPQTSYRLKDEFEEDTGIYVDNGQFKGAMRAAHYEPVSASNVNWMFRIRPQCRHCRRELPAHPRHRRFMLCMITELEKQQMAELSAQLRVMQLHGATTGTGNGTGNEGQIKF